MDSTILELADRNRREAFSILETLQIEAIWRSVGATPHLVGSLRSGLLMKHLDIDLHIYSPAPLHIGDSFAALSRIARNSGIRKIEYANLLDAEDNCLEWHVQYAAQDGRLWQIDMIHLPEGVALGRVLRTGRRPYCDGADPGDARGDPASEIRNARRREDPRHRLLPGGSGRGRAQLRGICGLAAGTPRRGNHRMDAVNEEKPKPPETNRP